MLISKNKVVSLQYELREGHAEGQFVEKTTAENPLVFLFGAGSMLPDFEANLKDLKAGDTFAFGLSSDKAYGVKEDSAIIEMPLTNFIVDGKLAGDLLKIDNVIPMRDNHGRVLRGRVAAVSGETVTMDFNHPMAGKDLFFSGVINDVREATAAEISHGHVHGPGGHHH